MDVHASVDVEEYSAAARAFLEADPCARNVLLTIIDALFAAKNAGRNTVRVAGQ